MFEMIMIEFGCGLNLQPESSRRKKTLNETKISPSVSLTPQNKKKKAQGHKERKKKQQTGRKFNFLSLRVNTELSKS